MPVDMKRYPPDWKQISLRIRERARGRCEWCAAPNNTWILRKPGTPEWITHMDWLCRDDRNGLAWQGWRKTFVVLTVAHLGTPHADGTPGDKHDKHDVRDENLAALCQRCHLLYDIDEHVANAAATRRRKKIDAGQTELFEVTP